LSEDSRGELRRSLWFVPSMHTMMVLVMGIATSAVGHELIELF
jgi:hypothetical protein